MTRALAILIFLGTPVLAQEEVEKENWRRAHPERQLQFEERQREIARLVDDKRVFTAAWSAELCVARETGAAAAKEIPRERRNAKRSGDGERLSQLQRTVDSAAGRLTRARAKLKERHLAQRACKDNLVAELRDCLTDEGQPAPNCDDLRVEVLYEQPQTLPAWSRFDDLDFDRAAVAAQRRRAAGESRTTGHLINKMRERLDAPDLGPSN